MESVWVILFEMSRRFQILDLGLVSEVMAGEQRRC